MASLDWHLTRTGEITLVELVVTSETDARVEIESTLTPVWPPRRRGRPVAGWDGPRFEKTVTTETPLVVGYATPAEPADPPATITSSTPVDKLTDTSPTPQELIRALGDAGPSSEAVPRGVSNGSPKRTHTVGSPSGTIVDSPGYRQSSGANSGQYQTRPPQSDVTATSSMSDREESTDRQAEVVETRRVTTDRLR